MIRQQRIVRTEKRSDILIVFYFYRTIIMI